MNQLYNILNLKIFMMISIVVCSCNINNEKVDIDDIENPIFKTYDESLQNIDTIIQKYYQGSLQSIQKNFPDYKDYFYLQDLNKTIYFGFTYIYFNDGCLTLIGSFFDEGHWWKYSIDYFKINNDTILKLSPYENIPFYLPIILKIKSNTCFLYTVSTLFKESNECKPYRELYFDSLSNEIFFSKCDNYAYLHGIFGNQFVTKYDQRIYSTNTNNKKKIMHSYKVYKLDILSAYMLFNLYSFSESMQKKIKTDIFNVITSNNFFKIEFTNDFVMTKLEAFIDRDGNIDTISLFNLTPKLPNNIPKIDLDRILNDTMTIIQTNDLLREEGIYDSIMLNKIHFFNYKTFFYNNY